MALPLLSTLVWATILYTAYSYASSWIRHRQLGRFAAQNGATLPQSQNAAVSLVYGIWRLGTAAWRGGDLFDLFLETFEKKGATFVTGETIVTADAQNMQTMLATRFADFEIGEFRNREFSLLLGRSIFASDGPKWEHSRAMFKPLFSRQNLNHLGQTEKSVQDLFRALELVGKRVGDGVEVDIRPLLFRFTIDTATEFLFGESVGSQMAAASPSSGRLTSAATAMAADLSGSNMTFAEAFHEAQVWIANRIRSKPLRWLVPSKKGRQGVAYVRKYTQHYVQMALDMQKKEEGNTDAKTRSLLEILAQSTKDETELRDQILGLLLAGRDTTASLLAWTLSQLSRNPDAFEKLRAAVLEQFGPYSADPTTMAFESLKACHYLQYVLRESLRIETVAPVNSRVAIRDTVLPRGGGPDGQTPLVVKQGQNVVFVPLILHRRKDIWGPDADEFNPDRWVSRKLDWNFIPFSGGPRICLGQQFALTEAGYFLVRLLQRFEKLDWLGPAKGPKRETHLSMTPDAVPLRLLYAQT